MAEVFILIQETITGDDDHVILTRLVSCSAVDADDPGILLTLYGIGLKTVPVGHIVDVDLFEGQVAGCIQESAVDTQASLIMQVGSGRPRPLDLGFQHV